MRTTKGSMCGSIQRVLLAAGCLAIVVGGCGILKDAFRSDRVLSPFSHAVHVTGEEMECFDCHEPVEGSAEPVLPDRALCTDCHDPEDEEEAQRLAPFFAGDRPKWVHAGRLGGDLKFSHAPHTPSGEKDCRTCHDAVARSDAVRSGLRMSMEQCIECHEARGAEAADCAACHAKLNRNVKPRTHDGAWIERHGNTWRTASGTSTVLRCELCHAEASCNECHLNTRPRSHDQFWRGRGHGILAGMDRERCAVCHRRDTCDRCHSEKRPRSHKASFGKPLNRHCFTCHLPLGFGDSCAVCHAGTPSHEAAPSLPGDSKHQIAGDADCRTCHFPLPHPDNGDSCRFCHE